MILKIALNYNSFRSKNKKISTKVKSLFFVKALFVHYTAFMHNAVVISFKQQQFLSALIRNVHILRSRHNFSTFFSRSYIRY